MYINYFNSIEQFETTEPTCPTDTPRAGKGCCPKLLEVEEATSCENYKDGDYKDLRDTYIGKANELYSELEPAAADGTEDAKVTSDKTCIEDKIYNNNKKAREEINNYTKKIEEDKKTIDDLKNKSSHNKTRLEEIENNIELSKQKLENSKKSNSTYNIKLIVYIIAIIVLVIIELILILL